MLLVELIREKYRFDLENRLRYYKLKRKGKLRRIQGKRTEVLFRKRYSSDIIHFQEMIRLHEKRERLKSFVDYTGASELKWDYELNFSLNVN